MGKTYRKERDFNKTKGTNSRNVTTRRKNDDWRSGFEEYKKSKDEKQTVLCSEFN